MRRLAVVVTLTTAVALAFFAVWWLALRENGVTVRNDSYEDVRPQAERSQAPSVTPMGLSQQRQSRENAITQAIEKTNVPIEFWGKVVDQEKKPIEGALVHYSYSTEHGNTANTAWAQQRTHKSETLTDAAGMFAISNIKGHTLSVDSVARDGFSYSPKKAKVYNYYGDIASGKFTPKSTDPELFVMVSNAIGDQLVKHGGAFGKIVQLPADGTPVRWSLFKGQLDPTGELRLIFSREPPVLARVGESAVWSLKIGVIDGGIVEALPDEQFYQAPTLGYRPELDYPKLEQKRGVPARSFYLRTADGKYGRVDLDLYADDEGPSARCLIKAVINRSGSVTLEGASPK